MDQSQPRPLNPHVFITRLPLTLRARPQRPMQLFASMVSTLLPRPTGIWYGEDQTGHYNFVFVWQGLRPLHTPYCRDALETAKPFFQEALGQEVAIPSQPINIDMPKAKYAGLPPVEDAGFAEVVDFFSAILELPVDFLSAPYQRVSD